MLGRAVERLAASSKLVKMALAAKSIGRPNAAQDICKQILQRLKKGS
jgi:hypothetical protein